MTDKPYTVYVKIDAELYNQYKDYLYQHGLINDTDRAHGISAVNSGIFERGVKKFLTGK